MRRSLLDDLAEKLELKKTDSAIRINYGAGTVGTCKVAFVGGFESKVEAGIPEI
jgi:hypothetical protein